MGNCVLRELDQAASEQFRGNAGPSGPPGLPALLDLVPKDDMTDYDREAITAFLSNKKGYAPQPNEIVGILKRMQDTLEAVKKTNLQESLVETKPGLPNNILGVLGCLSGDRRPATTMTTDVMEERLGALRNCVLRELDQAASNLMESERRTVAGVASTGMCCFGGRRVCESRNTCAENAAAGIACGGAFKGRSNLMESEKRLVGGV